MYGRVLLGELKDKFTAVVDLWSAGATMYHVSCGRVPFQAYNGREDRKTMYVTSNIEITSIQCD